MQIQQLTVGMMGVCCYIASCEKTKKAAIIDPGGDEQRILDACKDLTVTHIIATHGHPDHVCGVGPIKDATGAPFVMYGDDADFFGQKEIQDYFSMLGLPEAPPVDIKVNDGDHITIGEEEFLVIHTPGHTPGGMCLYCAPDLITGDTLFVDGVGRTDFPGGSSSDLLHSIKERLLTLPPQTVVWPGHGYGGASSTIEREARSNPFIM